MGTVWEHGEYRNSAIEYMVERAEVDSDCFMPEAFLQIRVDPHDDYSHFLNNKADFKKEHCLTWNVHLTMT